MTPEEQRQQVRKAIDKLLDGYSQSVIEYSGEVLYAEDMGCVIDALLELSYSNGQHMIGRLAEDQSEPPVDWSVAEDVSMSACHTIATAFRQAYKDWRKVI